MVLLEHPLHGGELHRVEDDKEQHPPRRKRDDLSRSGRGLIAPQRGSGGPRRSSSCGLSPNRHWRDRLANGGVALTRAAKLAFGLLLLRCPALECTARTDMFYLSKPQTDKDIKSSAKREE